MYGGMRFDPDGMLAAEWRPFGSFYFFVPQVCVCECCTFSLYGFIFRTGAEVDGVLLQVIFSIRTRKNF
jgi:hypothetical protein